MYCIVLSIIIAYNFMENIESTSAKHVLSVFDWSGCSSTEFNIQTFSDVSIKRCAQYCKARPSCSRFNYYTTRKTCTLLEQQGAQMVHNSNRPCVTVLREDIDQTLTCDAGDHGCTDTECPIASVDNAEIKGNVQSVGSKAQVTCKPLHEMTIGNPEINCAQSGQWENIPTCAIVIICQDPPPVPFTDITFGTNAAGEVRTYSCVAGKALDPTGGSVTTTTCTVLATWTPTTFSCITDCGIPGSIDNAILQNGPTVESTSRTYICNNGFITTIGTTNLQVTCQQNGDWTTPAAYCVKNCNEPDPIDNADLASGQTGESAVRTYTCQSGFTPSVGFSGFSVTCQSDGTWTSTSVTCVPGCSLPTAKSRASYSIDLNTYEGSIATYTCDATYMIKYNNNKITNHVVTCTGGQWVDMNFKCVPECPGPSDTYEVIGTQNLKICMKPVQNHAAKDACSVNGQLVIVDSDEKHLAITNHLKAHSGVYSGWNFWIQGKYNHWDDEWYLDDNTALTSYQFSAGAYLASSSRPCLNIANLDYWVNINCDKYYGYICQMP